MADTFANGRYQTLKTKIADGLPRLTEPEALAELREAIAVGIDQANQGRVAPFNARKTLTRLRSRS